MGLSRVFGLCAALLFASSVSAAVTIDLGPSDYRNWGSGSFHHHANGINSKFGQTVRMPPMNTNLTVTRNPVIPYGSIVNGAKNFVRINPASAAASAALTALFLGLDWVFDPELDEWMTEGADIQPVDNRYIRWQVIGRPEWGVFATPQEVCDHHVVRNPTHTVTSCYRVSDTRWRFDFVAPTTQGTYNVERLGQDCAPGYTFSSTLGACVQTSLVPLSESDWVDFEAYLPAAPADQVGAAAGDMMQRQGAPLNGYSDMTIEGPSSVAGPETTSTSTNPVTGDTVTTSTQTTTNISYGDTTITTTNTTTTNTYTNGTHTGTEVVTETPGELPVTEGGGVPPAGEWPGFCDWAGIVCDWIGWTQEEPPAEPELPQVIDDDFYEEKDISFGAKSCPPDYEITIPFLNTVVAVPMQPFCDFAGIIYYMVMAASYIIAAYITVGVVRNG